MAQLTERAIEQYLVLTLGDAREATPAINKTLNPEWNQTFDLPIVGVQSLLLEGVCWDKDRFSKDYMGEFDVALEDIFTSNSAKSEPRWFPLQSRKSGKKKSDVSGEVLLQFELVDPLHSSATPEQLYQKFLGIAVTTPSAEDEDEELERMDSGDLDETEEEESSDEADDLDKAEKKKEKKRKRLRMKKLRRKAKERAYEFYGSSDVAGVLFLEIQKITDLPPEKNSKFPAIGRFGLRRPVALRTFARVFALQLCSGAVFIFFRKLCFLDRARMASRLCARLFCVLRAASCLCLVF